MTKKHNHKSPAIIDIVVVTCGRFDMLKICLDAVYREAQTNPINLILVDNGSPQDERNANMNLLTYQPEKDPAHHVNFLTKRIPNILGFPESTNEGSRMSRAPLIMFLNDDAELTEGTLDKVIKDFDDIRTGIVGIKLMFPLNSTNPGRPAGRVQHVGMTLNIRGDPIHPLVGWPSDDPKCCITRENCFAVTGACLTVRRNIFKNAGGFDKAFGKGTFEDVDLAMKVHQMGLNVKMDAQASAYHYTGASTEKLNQGFNIGYNALIWKTRWLNSGILKWDEFDYW